MEGVINSVAVWFVTFLAAISFVFSMKTQRVNSYIFYTISFAASTATVVVLLGV